jgi:hypothetical protein
MVKLDGALSKKMFKYIPMTIPGMLLVKLTNRVPDNTVIVRASGPIDDLSERRDLIAARSSKKWKCPSQLIGNFKGPRFPEHDTRINNSGFQLVDVQFIFAERLAQELEMTLTFLYRVTSDPIIINVTPVGNSLGTTSDEEFPIYRGEYNFGCNAGCIGAHRYTHRLTILTLSDCEIQPIAENSCGIYLGISF